MQHLLSLAVHRGPLAMTPLHPLPALLRARLRYICSISVDGSKFESDLLRRYEIPSLLVYIMRTAIKLFKSAAGPSRAYAQVATTASAQHVSADLPPNIRFEGFEHADEPVVRGCR